MKYIILDGKYSHDHLNYFEGTIVLFQFESFDKGDDVSSIYKTLESRYSPKFVILVPFSHLSNDVLNFEDAFHYTKFLHEIMFSKYCGNVFLSPFGVEKKLFIDSGDSVEVKLFSTSPNNSSDKVKKTYNDYANVYDQHMLTSGHYEAQEKLLHKVSDYIGKSLIDLACGTSFLSQKIIQRLSIDRIHLNDLSPEMISFSIKRVEKYNKKTLISFSNLNAKCQLVDNIKFETVLCCNLLYYFKDKKDLPLKWSTLIEKGGNIILFEESPFVFPSSDTTKSFSKSLIKILHYVTPSEIVNLFKKNGFSLLENQSVSIDEQHSLHGYVFSLR